MPHFPVIIFGKKAHHGSVPGFYQVLSKAPEIDADMEQSLHEVKNLFAWEQPAKTQRFAPVYAAWPYHSADLLIARFLDEGRDDQERPHCLRIEAAFAKDLRKSENVATIAAFLCAEAWPQAVLHTPWVTLEPGEVKQERVELVRNALFSSLPQPVFVHEQRESTVHNLPFESLLAPQTVEKSQRKFVGTSGEIFHHKKVSNSPITSKKYHFLLYVIFFIIGMIMGVIVDQHLVNDKDEIKFYREEKQRLAEERRKLNSEIEDCRKCQQFPEVDKTQ